MRKRTWSELDQGSACDARFKGKQALAGVLASPPRHLLAHKLYPRETATGRLGNPDTHRPVMDGHSLSHGKRRKA